MVTAVDGRAAAAGLFAGQALADARAVLPGVVLVPADAEGDAAFLGRLALWAMRFTPLVALEGMDGLLLDVTGCAHLFGGEAALLAEVVGRLERQGVGVCAALAGAPLAAMALARAGIGGVLAEGCEAAAVHRWRLRRSGSRMGWPGSSTPWACGAWGMWRRSRGPGWCGASGRGWRCDWTRRQGC